MVEKILIHYLQYNEATLDNQILDNQSMTDFHKPVEHFIQWYDIRGLHDTILIEEIGKVFSLHPLVLEDIVDTSQRPKLDEYEQGLFFTLKAVQFNKSDRKPQFEQVALYLGQGFVLSFQETADDLFLNIRTRLQKGGGRIRKRGADYLLYALMDTIVDQYYIALDDVEHTIEEMEKEVTETHSSETRTKIYDLKQEVLAIRRSVVPLRELIANMLKTEDERLLEATEVYLYDLRDHVLQIIDLTDTYRDNLNSLHDLYLSEVSFQTNKIMQVLTIVSTIFIPLTFLAGIYGMNFDHMPELHWRYGYFGLLGLMVVIFLFMLWYFRRLRWF